MRAPTKTAGVASTGPFRILRWSGAVRVVNRMSLYFILAAGAVAFGFPFFWLVATSLKPESEVFQFPPTFIPSSVQWSNYSDAIGNFPLLQGLRNTFTIIALVEVGRLLSVTLAAYAFARFEFPLRGALFVIVLATMMLPYHITLIPQYLIFRDLGWLNSFKPLTVPAFFGAGGAFFIFLLRQFFLTLPKEYDDAAAIDGCGPFRRLWYVILPLSKAPLGVVAIFTFMAEWNDFFGPLIYLTDPDKYTLALSFQTWQAQAEGAVGVEPLPFNQIMAMATLITLVPVVMFFFTQRYFIQGVVLSGLKE